jgi:hypothetical protein
LGPTREWVGPFLFAALHRVDSARGRLRVTRTATNRGLTMNAFCGKMGPMKMRRSEPDGNETL